MSNRLHLIFRHLAAIISTAVLLACTIACDPSTSDRDLVYLDSYKAIDLINQAPGAFSSPKKWAFIDPRSRQDYATKHIAGAISLPFEDMTLEAQGLLGSYDFLIVYDTDYDDIIAKAASKRLLELRFKEVYTLEGGLKAWEKAGNAVQVGVPADAPELPNKPVI